MKSYILWGILTLLVLLSPGVYVGLKMRPSLPTVIPGKRYIACIGDSITFGAGVSVHRDTQSYPAYLQTLVSDEYQILNYGFSGKTLLRGGDMPYEKSGFLNAAISAKPEIMLIMLGTNDSKPYNWNAENYATEYRELLHLLLEKLPNTKLYVMIPPAAFPKLGTDTVVYDIRADVIVNEIRPIIQKMGIELKIPIIDLHQATDGHPEFFADGVHPNKEGNEYLAQTIASALGF